MQNKKKFCLPCNNHSEQYWTVQVHDNFSTKPLQEKFQKKDDQGDVSSFSSDSGVTLDCPLKVLSVAKKEGESY